MDLLHRKRHIGGNGRYHLLLNQTIGYGCAKLFFTISIGIQPGSKIICATGHRLQVSQFLIDHGIRYDHALGRSRLTDQQLLNQRVQHNTAVILTTSRIAQLSLGLLVTGQFHLKRSQKQRFAIYFGS